jgi:hypothetical protein
VVGPAGAKGGVTGIVSRLPVDPEHDASKNTTETQIATRDPK